MAGSGRDPPDAHETRSLLVAEDRLRRVMRGSPLGYTVVPANEHEYEPLADLLTGTPAEVVIADKGFWGRAYAERLAAEGIRLMTPHRQ